MEKAGWKQPFHGTERVAGKTAQQCVEDSAGEANVITEILYQNGYQMDVLSALGCLLIFTAKYKNVYPQLKFEALAQLLAEMWLRAGSEWVPADQPMKPSGWES